MGAGGGGLVTVSEPAALPPSSTSVWVLGVERIYINIRGKGRTLGDHYSNFVPGIPRLTTVWKSPFLESPSSKMPAHKQLRFHSFIHCQSRGGGASPSFPMCPNRAFWFLLRLLLWLRVSWVKPLCRNLWVWLGSLCCREADSESSRWSSFVASIDILMQVSPLDLMQTLPAAVLTWLLWLHLTWKEILCHCYSVANRAHVQGSSLCREFRARSPPSLLPYLLSLNQETLFLPLGASR